MAHGMTLKKYKIFVEFVHNTIIGVKEKRKKSLFKSKPFTF